MWKRGPQFERAEIMRIQAADPAFVLVFDLPLDGREELRFTRTHPLVDAWIRDNFVPVPNLTQNPAYRIYRNANAVP